jgi:hypothetical protein
MTRDKALALFDALVVRGYHAQLTVFHGHEPRRHGGDRAAPLYAVSSGPIDHTGFELEDLHTLAAIADEHDVKVTLYGTNESGLGARFSDS